MAEVIGYACYCSCGDGVVSAEHQRYVMADAQRIGYDSRQFLAGFGDLRDIFCVGWAVIGEAFGLRYIDVAEVRYVVAKRGCEFRAEACYAYGAGSHVDAAAALSEIEWRSDDGDSGFVDAGMVMGRVASP